MAKKGKITRPLVTKPRAPATLLPTWAEARWVAKARALATCSVAAKKVEIKGSDQITLKVGSASVTLKKSGDIDIKGKNLKLDGKGKIDLKAIGKLTTKGAQIAEN